MANWGVVYEDVGVMFGIGFVCLSVCRNYVWHGVCLFVRLFKLCLAWGLSVCLSVQVMFGMGFVCLSVSGTYVWHWVFLEQAQLINCFWNIW